MPGPHNYSTQSLKVVYFAEFPDIKFQQMSGGEKTRTQPQTTPGGERTPKNVGGGNVSVSEVTLTTPYDPVRHARLETWAAGYDNGAEVYLTLVAQPTNAAGIPTGKADTYIGCGMTRFKKPDANSESDETAMLEIAVQPERML